MKLDEIPPYVPFRLPEWAEGYFWEFDTDDEGIGGPILFARTIPDEHRGENEPQFDDAELFVAQEWIREDRFEICKEEKYWGWFGKAVFLQWLAGTKKG